jgi:hypothetical protein
MINNINMSLMQLGSVNLGLTLITYELIKILYLFYPKKSFSHNSFTKFKYYGLGT